MNEIGLLFNSLGPLERLIISHCDVHVYLTPFLHPQEHHSTERLVTFPPVKELAILHPMSLARGDSICTEAILGLARLQHALGVPFERVTVCMETLPTTLFAEDLGQWVGVVNCYEERDY